MAVREFDLLAKIYQASKLDPRRVPIGPGDDMGMVRLDGTDALLAVDQLVEGVHFNLTDASIESIGCKAVNRSLSDVAAMAAVPIGALATACLPRSLGEARADALFQAMHRTARQHDCPLFGGDITIWDGPLVLTVTVAAEPVEPGPVRRDGARVGDHVFVTGLLGGSITSGRHLTFEPRIREALALLKGLGPRLHAMIDLSDGLGRDAGHIAHDSGAAIHLDAKLIPCHPGVTWQQALGDGEDYELAFTTDIDADALRKIVPSVWIQEVGRVEPAKHGPAVLVIEPDGTQRSGEQFGWEHAS
ncbi:MAG: thiamine-phosphate kinase [Phycisphaerales bacterium]|nr:thiamine-phosphate kinase [Phycisphaerales bacterium]